MSRCGKPAVENLCPVGVFGPENPLTPALLSVKLGQTVIRELFAVRRLILKYIFRVLILLAVLAVSLPALAQEKCNAIPWGEKLSVVEQIKFSHNADGISYYTVTKVEPCGLNKLEDTRVTYGFRDNKLYATFVEIDHVRSLGNVVGLMIDEYGLPDTKVEEGWDVYRWETDSFKVKLKSQYSTDRVKIGTYYKPLDPK